MPRPSVDPAFDWHYLCKFILIGDSSVGKSALLLRVTDDRFLAEEAEPTVGVEFGSVTIALTDGQKAAAALHPSSSSADARRETSSSDHGPAAGSSSTATADVKASSASSVSSLKVKAQIWDTAGQERFRNITRSYYRGAAGCLLVYDVTHRPSFTNAKGWLRDLRDQAEEDAVIVLVGNRVDLCEGEGSKRKVPVEEARTWAAEEGILFIETSAKTGHNVRAAFEGCVSEIHRRFEASQAATSGDPSSSAGTLPKSAASLLKSRDGGAAGKGGRRGAASGSGGEGISLQSAAGQIRPGCCSIM